MRNAAWNSAQTPWIAFVDADCKILPGWLKTVLSVIETDNSSLLAAFGGQNFIPQNSNRFYDSLRLLLPTFVGGHSSTLNRLCQFSKTVPHLPTLNIVFNRQALTSVGGFDPHFVRVGEDIDLS